MNDDDGNCVIITEKILYNMIHKRMCAYFGKTSIPILALLLISLFSTSLCANTGKYRCTWRDNPSTTMVIGWEQISGEDPELFYDLVDKGVDATKYAKKQAPNNNTDAKSMNNQFVRLTGLKPNTTYYFIIKDSEGVSKRMNFQTAPDNPDTRLSIVAGGDSRNAREIRAKSNKLVAKLRPNVVLFGGDMTDADEDNEWKEWLDDWQYSIAADGHLTPILVCRGNHESINATLIDLFDLAAENMYYALNLGGNLLRVYTLNSFLPPGGDQKAWLNADLEQNKNTVFRMAQYHLPMRPHVNGKENNDEQVLHWANLFNKYQVSLAVECDAHVIKYTYPIRPSLMPGATDGFVRDDERGTVYVGEGTWGAPLRTANNNRAWTRNSEAFHGFHWIWVDKTKMEVRTVRSASAEKCVALTSKNIFDVPAGLELWKPSNGGILTIMAAKTTATDNNANIGNEDTDNVDWEKIPKLTCDPTIKNIHVKYNLTTASDVKFRLLNLRLGEVGSKVFPAQAVGAHDELLAVDKVPVGRYFLIIKAGKKIAARYVVIKK
jgi:acid phosphatase type 7